MKYEDLTTKELVANLIGARAAERLYTDSLRSLFSSEMPKRAHNKLWSARELVRRWLNEEIRLGPLMNDRELVEDYLRMIFDDQEREIFVALYLNSVLCLIETEILFFGTVDVVAVHPREVIKLALEHNASAIILAHNHPSGVAIPSMDDRLITIRIRRAAALFDIRLIDHFIVSGALIESFADRGLL